MNAATEVITAAEVKQVEQERVSLLATFSHRYGLEANNMMRTLRATVLRPSSNGTEPSNEQVAAFLIVANHHQLNPFTKEVHGFVDKRGGIVPIVGVDGWAKKINEHQQFDGMDFEQDDEKCTCTIYRKDRSHPVRVTEYLIECKQASPAWTSHPKRMLRHRAMVQCARIAFSLAGVYDPDEGEQVLAAQDAIDVTPEVERAQETNFGPAKIGAVKMRTICEGAIEAARTGDAGALWATWGALSNAEVELVWKQLRSYERTAIKKLLESPAYKVAQSGLDVQAWSISALRAAKNPEDLDKTYGIVEEIYAEHDQEVPLDIQTVRTDRKTELGAQ